MSKGLIFVKPLGCVWCHKIGIGITIGILQNLNSKNCNSKLLNSFVWKICRINVELEFQFQFLCLKGKNKPQNWNWNYKYKIILIIT